MYVEWAIPYIVQWLEEILVDYPGQHAMTCILIRERQGHIRLQRGKQRDHRGRDDVMWPLVRMPAVHRGCKRNRFTTS